MAKPFLQCHRRFKNGKDHCYWSIAEKVRTHRGWGQRHLLYLGEINDSQKEAWTKLTEVFDPQSDLTRPLALYPAEREVPEHAAEYGVQVRLKEFVSRRTRRECPRIEMGHRVSAQVIGERRRLLILALAAGRANASSKSSGENANSKEAVR